MTTPLHRTTAKTATRTNIMTVAFFMLALVLLNATPARAEPVAVPVPESIAAPVAAPLLAPATQNLTQIPAPEGGTITTTTTEKTTTTNYTVTSRKVGLVGNRPYPASTSQLTGGIVKQVTINGMAASQEIIAPDTVAPLKDQVPNGDYYTNNKAADAYKGTAGNVRIHETGRLNR